MITIKIITLHRPEIHVKNWDKNINKTIVTYLGRDTNDRTTKETVRKLRKGCQVEEEDQTQVTLRDKAAWRRKGTDKDTFVDNTISYFYKQTIVF